MAQLKVCRICLAMDLKMFNLCEYPLANSYEAVTGWHPQYTVGLPLHACFECAALLKKYYDFKHKCSKSQLILFNFLNTNGVINRLSIASIDRQELSLKSCLKKQVVYNGGNLKDVYPVLPIKLEKLFSQSEVFDDAGEETKPEAAPVSPIAGLSSDDEDNEPLAWHKSLGNNEEPAEPLLEALPSPKMEATEKVPITKGKRKARKTNIIDAEMENYVTVVKLTNEEPAEPLLEALPSPKMEATEKVPITKGKRKARKTNIIDTKIENYVTVVKLTLEEQIEEINKRKESSNYKTAVYQCEFCYKGFVNTDAWNHHMAKHDPKAGSEQCVVCKMRFTSKRRLTKHLSIHKAKYLCKLCPFVSQVPTQARKHQGWHKGVVYKCQYCDEISTKWTSYLSHVRKKHPSQWVCELCGYSYVSATGLNLHRTRMHKDYVPTEADEKQKYCETCDVRFVGEEAWKRHLVTSAKHRDDQSSEGCKTCGEMFDNAESLRLHKRTHAKKRLKNYGKKPTNTSWPTKCQECSEEIPNARAYWVHFQRAHPGKAYPIVKKFICDICGKSFRGNAFLVYHMRTHSTERSFKCDQCPKAFFNGNNLQMHQKMHSDLRPYVCSVCHKGFKFRAALNRHSRSHTGVKPYTCEFCGKSFNQSSSCKLHVRTVHLKQPAPYVSKARLQRRQGQLDKMADMDEGLID